MCGIVGYVGPREASPVIMQGLRKLEYRGYDSAGIAVFTNGQLEVRRSVGKLDNLESLLTQQPIHGTTGIGHTRWATHGRPSEQNAHPHRAGGVVVIHNGIIENYLELRAKLESRGRKIVVGDRHRGHRAPDRRVRARGPRPGRRHAPRGPPARRRLRDRRHVREGAEAHRRREERDARSSSASATARTSSRRDIPAAARVHARRRVPRGRRGRRAVARERSSSRRSTGSRSTAKPRHITWDAVTAQKGGYKHFMLKEIHEQPQALIDTMRGRLDAGSGRRPARPRRHRSSPSVEALRARRVRHGVARVPRRQVHDRAPRAASRCDVDSAASSATATRSSTTRRCVIVVSQSGETADTLAGARGGPRARRARSWRSATSSTRRSRARATGVLYTHAGPEIGVASTKAFTTQLTALYLLALQLGRRRGVVDAERGAPAHRRARRAAGARRAESLGQRAQRRGDRARSTRTRATSSSSAAASTTRSRSRARSSSRRSRTSTPRATRRAR